MIDRVLCSSRLISDVSDSGTKWKSINQDPPSFYDHSYGVGSIVPKRNGNTIVSTSDGGGAPPILEGAQSLSWLSRLGLGIPRIVSCAPGELKYLKRSCSRALKWVPLSVLLQCNGKVLYMRLVRIFLVGCQWQWDEITRWGPLVPLKTAVRLEYHSIRF